MIKDFLKITEKDLQHLVNQSIRVVEKMDMIYFRVDVNDSSCIPLRLPTFSAISDIDMMTNKVYKDIKEFTVNVIEPHRKEIYDMFGRTSIGFMYLPVAKTRYIEYTKAAPGTFFISFGEHKKNKSAFVTDALANILGISNKTILKPFDTADGKIVCSEKGITPEDIMRIVHGYDNPLDVARELLVLLTGETDVDSLMPTKSLSESEGIIIKSRHRQYQIVINSAEPQIDKSTKKIYRDTLLISLANESVINGNVIDKIKQGSTYIENVTAIFEDYMNRSSIMSKFSFDPEDLLPPIDGYMGDVDYDAIPSETVKTICKINPVAKNIYRLFLHTFTHRTSENKFKGLPTNVQEALCRLTESLGYKNYADIARCLTK